MKRKCLAKATASHALKLIVAGGLSLSGAEIVQAAEPEQSYSRAPMAAYNALMDDALLGNPYESGIAAAYLIFGGVMDTFPKLDVMLPHAGGTFPWLSGRFDRGGLQSHPPLQRGERLGGEFHLRLRRAGELALAGRPWAAHPRDHRPVLERQVGERPREQVAG